MSARDEILASIRARRAGSAPAPARYERPSPPGDPVARFVERASVESAEVHILDRMDDVPAAVTDILRSRNMAAAIHLPPNGRMDEFPWSGGLSLERTAPGPDDAALAIAPFAIAETGTLVHAATPDAPPSWHFRAGLEIAVVPAGNVLPRLEDVVARLKTGGTFPSTVNLVTGPSRTGDIEQTLELGAHGPKALVILVVKG